MFALFAQQIFYNFYSLPTKKTLFVSTGPVEVLYIFFIIHLYKKNPKNSKLCPINEALSRAFSRSTSWRFEI